MSDIPFCVITGLIAAASFVVGTQSHISRRTSAAHVVKRSARAAIVAALLLRFGLSNCAQAITYRVTLLNPPNNLASRAHGVGDGFQVGFGAGPPTSERNHALLWSGTAASAIDLHPTGFEQSYAVDVDDGFQVGRGEIAGTNRALMWNGSAESVIDLTPRGLEGSVAFGIDNRFQVGAGFGLSTEGYGHALLWRGSAASVVDLHPPGFSSSTAYAISGGTQVGLGFPNKIGHHHALLWKGTTESVVDLHPPGFDSSWATGTSGPTQVGGAFNVSGFPPSRALLWHGTAASVVDLNPPGFGSCEATGVAGGFQVGSCRPLEGGGSTHALRWRGTADSFVDLHSYLDAWGLSFTSSQATAIAVDGTIVGYVWSFGMPPIAVLWTPIPEPDSAVLVSGILTLSLIFRARHHRR